MKTILIFILVLPIFCFAQKKQDATGQIDFGAYEKSKVEEHDNLILQFKQLTKNFRVLDSVYWKFIQDELAANKIDFSRLSQHSDSLRISSQGIFYILKPKKK